MPKQSLEQRVAALEKQMQGLADHIAEDVHGWGRRPGYRMEWALIDEEPEPQWAQIYNWVDDPSHPLHQRVGSGG